MSTDRVRFDFERLTVFGRALELVAIVDTFAGELPAGRGYLRDQLRRAANSVPLNIAEGAGEFSPSEKSRFYRMARRSATECAGQVLVCRRLGLGSELGAVTALNTIEELVRMLVALVRSGRGARED